MKQLIVLQARTGSTRLPNKMLMPFYDGECILSILLGRLQKAIPDAKEVIVVATTTAKGDDAIVECCNNIGINTFRGSEQDVLNRFIMTARHFNAQKLIRVCADNVFIDTRNIKNLYDQFITSDYDYQSFCTSDGTPSIKTHYGFWAEAVTAEALETVARSTDEPLYHEHVTNFIYSGIKDFKIHLTPIEETINGIESHKNLRLTVDTPADFKVQQEIYADLVNNGREITPQNIINYLESRPDLYEIMARTISENSK